MALLSRAVHLSALFIYPVKSVRGCAVDEATVDPRGLAGDRRFMVVDADGKFLSQRTLPRLALIGTRLDAATLSLEAPRHGVIEIPRDGQPDADQRQVSVWSSGDLTAEDCGDAVAGWLSDFLSTSCRLVRAGAAFRRPVRKVPAGLEASEVAFADAFPGLLLTEASLRALNDRLIARGEEMVPMDRFRPNLVVAGATPHAEDGWTRVRIGRAVLRCAGPCARCVMTTIDQQTGERGVEPLRTLSSYRRDARQPGDVNFGQNVIPEGVTGIVRVGDPVSTAA